MSETLRLTPMDVALFRDARPFSADDSTGARLQSELPPQLGLLGAMRLLLLRSGGLSFQKFRRGAGTEAVGARPEEPGSLRLGAVCVAREKDGVAEAVYRMPADLVWVGRKGSLRTRVGDWAYQVPKEDGVAVQTSLPEGLQLLWPAWFRENDLRLMKDSDRLQVSGETESRGLPLQSVTAYLTGKHVATADGTEYFRREKRIGIERNAATFTAVAGRLYTAEFLRARERVFFALPVLEAAEALPAGDSVLSIGGESRPFVVKRDGGVRLIPEDAREKVRARLTESAVGCGEGCEVRFRLILVSPAPPGGEARKGWLPRLPAMPGLRLEIYAAAVGRPRWLSGWKTGEDNKTKGGSPRNARPYIPEGSVFFVRARGATVDAVVDEILREFWCRSSLCEGQENLFDRCAGNGVTLVGAVPNAKS